MAAAVSGAALLGKGLDISLAALRQHDPYISSIVDVASQVALYTFGHRANEWVRRGTATPPGPQAPGGEGRGEGRPRPLWGRPRPSRSHGGVRGWPPCWGVSGPGGTPGCPRGLCVC